MAEIDQEAVDFMKNQPLEVEFFTGTTKKERHSARLTAGPLYLGTVTASTRKKLIAKLGDWMAEYYLKLDQGAG